MKQSIDKSIELLDAMRLIYGLSANQLEALNQGISALMTIKDGNYQLDTNNIDVSVKHSPDITKSEVIATLRALANIIEKGV